MRVELEIGLIIAVVGLLIIMFAEGYRKGFVRIVLSVGMTIVSMMLSLVLSGPCQSFIKNNTGIYNKMHTQMKEYVEKYVAKEADMASTQLQTDYIKELKLPATMQDKLIKGNTADMKLNMGVSSFSEYLATYLTDMLVEALAVAVLFIIIKLILRIVVMLLDIVSRLPVINGVNKTLGGAIGVAEGILIIWAACILLTAASGTSIGQRVFDAISSNKFLSFIYNNNILLNFMKKM